MTKVFLPYYDRRVKKIFFSLLSIISFGYFFVFTKAAYAADTLCPEGQFSALCNLKADKAGNFVGGIITLLLIVAVVVSLFFLVWGGIRWTMSGGDQAKVQSARSTIIAAIVGMVIAFLAFFIINVVMTIFTGQGIGGFTLPTLI